MIDPKGTLGNVKEMHEIPQAAQPINNRVMQDDRPVKVSIIIPVYNQAEYLAESIESALAQTYSNFEIVILNDGSSDNSYAIAKSYVQHYSSLGFDIKAISQPNQGLAAARNAGVLHSSGHFLLPLDADDRIDKNFIAKTLPLMTENIGVVTTYAQLFGDRQGIWYTKNPTLQQEMYENSICANSLIRRAAFAEAGGYNIVMKHGYEDWNLWIDLMKRGWKVALVEEPLFHYRVKMQSMLTEADTRRSELVALIHSLHPELYKQ
jgi:glycosyltransferase involved in cell wall biosynthesis